MDNSQLAERERAAQVAADQLCAQIKATAEDVALRTVEPERADGTNSLDRDFMAKLARREHLNDSFLADAV